MPWAPAQPLVLLTTKTQGNAHIAKWRLYFIKKQRTATGPKEGVCVFWRQLRFTSRG